MSQYGLQRFKKTSDLADRVARAWVDFAQTHRASPVCSIALSGGRISRSLYECFTRHARTGSLPTTNLLFFWADERCVPPDHVDSNYRLAREHLFAPLDIPERQTRRIKGELPPISAAEQATAEIRALVPGSPMPRLDLVILGMGEDGHVASLFPNTTQGGGATDIYCAVRGPKPPPDRVTLSYAMIEAAREVWVLVSGEGKKEALCTSLQPSSPTPLGCLIRQRQFTQIFADQADFA